MQQEIQTPQDLTKITIENLKEYFLFDSNIPQENYPYILTNFQNIIAQHLQYHPNYKTIL